MEELLRCPFCGREATINNAGGKYQAWCKHCCCIHMGEFYNTEAEAIAAWNRRVTQNIGKADICRECERNPEISKEMHDLLCDVLTDCDIADGMRAEITRIVRIWEEEAE